MILSLYLATLEFKLAAHFTQLQSDLCTPTPIKVSIMLIAQDKMEHIHRIVF